MHRLLIAALALSLLICAVAWGGVSDTAHARSIPWDCSDWQAAAAVDDAEDARVSVILESLATNRGKTLYCAVDQSDTFSKAETWEAGKDRNERDDTVYQGQNGRFRGFLAAQEGYLTDGESGVTGISRDRIFEFPEEERRRVKRTVRRAVPADDTRRIQGGWGPTGSAACNPNTAGQCPTFARNAYNANPPAVDWDELAQAAATAYCKGEGYQRATSVTASTEATELDWEYRETAWRSGNPITDHLRLYEAARTNSWSAVCVKTVRRRR